MFFREYKQIERPILFAIFAEFFIQVVNAAFLFLMPLYMTSHGYTDGDAAYFASWRYAGVLALALPLGIWIKGRKVKHLFYISAFGVPFFALLIIAGVHLHDHVLLITSQCIWGAMFTFIQIPILPFILRHASPETQTSAISLSYSTWSFASIFSSGVSMILMTIKPEIFSERNMLIGLSVIGFSALYCVSRIKIEERAEMHTGKRLDLRKHDWNLIAGALFPALLIAVGAGLTIPVINLFFKFVFALKPNVISLWNLLAAVMVAISALFVPRIKKNIGYKTAIPVTQSFAIIALILMATTEFYKTLPIGLFIAVGCYVLRQPLMNVAGPMTSEVAMKYVGRKNREITSALISAIWSGSWFIGMQFIFGMLRNAGWPYVDIFLITAGLYAVGVILYALLIRAYNKREAAGLIEE